MAGKWEHYGQAAERLYVDAGRTIDDIAQMLPDVSRKSIGQWSVKYGWEAKRKKAKIRGRQIADDMEDVLYEKVQELKATPAYEISSAQLDALYKVWLTVQRQRQESLSREFDHPGWSLDRFFDYCARVLPTDRITEQKDLITGFIQEESGEARA